VRVGGVSRALLRTHAGDEWSNYPLPSEIWVRLPADPLMMFL